MAEFYQVQGSSKAAPKWRVCFFQSRHWHRPLFGQLQGHPSAGLPGYTTDTTFSQRGTRYQHPGGVAAVDSASGLDGGGGRKWGNGTGGAKVRGSERTGSTSGGGSNGVLMVVVVVVEVEAAAASLASLTLLPV